VDASLCWCYRHSAAPCPPALFFWVPHTCWPLLEQPNTPGVITGYPFSPANLLLTHAARVGRTADMCMSILPLGCCFAYVCCCTTRLQLLWSSHQGCAAYVVVGLSVVLFNWRVYVLPRACLVCMYVMSCMHVCMPGAALYACLLAIVCMSVVLARHQCVLRPSTKPHRM
jgi:hypothetical protein